MKRAFPPLPAAALVLSLPLVACRSNEVEFDPEKQLELYMTTATYLWEDGSYIRAQDQAVKALEIDPDNRPMRRIVGWVRIQLGTTEDILIAERFFEDLYADGDEEVPVLLGLATVQERLGLLHNEASQAIASGERYTEASNPEERAAELSELSRDYWTRSRKNYERVLSEVNQNADALNGLQRVSALLGDYEGALDWSRQLLELSAVDLDARLATLHGADLTASEEDAMRSLVRDSVDLQVETHLFRTSILHRLGRTPEALTHVEQAISLDPDRADLYSIRAQLSAEIGLFEEAIADLDLFLRLCQHPFEHPDVRRAYDLRAECERRVAGGEVGQADPAD